MSETNTTPNNNYDFSTGAPKVHLDPATNAPYYVPSEAKDLKTFGLGPNHFYKAIKNRSEKLQTVSTLLAQQQVPEVKLTNEQLIAQQIATWQKYQPEQILHVVPTMEEYMPQFQTQFARKLYFLTNYNTVLKHLDQTTEYSNKDILTQNPAALDAMGQDIKTQIFNEKRSAKYQSDNSCGVYRKEYDRCTDIYLSIDATTRMQLPVLHQDVCAEPFLSLEQCISEHLENWHNTMHTLYRLEHSKLYKDLTNSSDQDISALNVSTYEAHLIENNLIMHAELNKMYTPTAFNTVDIAQDVVVDPAIAHNTVEFVKKVMPETQVVEQTPSLIQNYQQQLAKYQDAKKADFFALDATINSL